MIVLCPDNHILTCSLQVPPKQRLRAKEEKEVEEKRERRLTLLTRPIQSTSTTRRTKMEARAILALLSSVTNRTHPSSFTFTRLRRKRGRREKKGLLVLGS